MINHVLPFTLSLTFIIPVALALTYGGIWSAAGGIYALLLIPIVDYVSGLRTENMNPHTEERALIWYRALTWAWVPVQLAAIYIVIAVAGYTDHLSKLELIVVAASLGLVTGGIGITYAHEMMHQTNRFERALSEILMTSTLYGHFCIEHVHGHHLHVGTPKDPVTARFGESFYTYYPRAVFGSLASAWRIQRGRASRRGHAMLSWSNPFFRYLVASILYLVVAYALAGWFGVVLFVIQAVVGFSLLEIINYVEHYGLMRREIAAGRYERVQPHHSWNSSHRVTNFFLINLQRHSDHHAHPQRRYPVLQHHGADDAPQLPFGYSTMLMIALLPPVWFAVMNPKVIAWRERFHSGPTPGLQASTY